MMVCGLTRLASTILSRIWPADNRAPTPARSGREVALEALLRKRTAMAQQAQADLPVQDDLRARAGSPAAPVRDDGRLSLAAALPAAASSTAAGSQPHHTISRPWFFSGTSR